VQWFIRLAKIGVKDLAKETLDGEYFGQSEKFEDDEPQAASTGPKVKSEKRLAVQLLHFYKQILSITKRARN